LTETNGELCNVAGLPGSDPNPENELLNKDVERIHYTGSDTERHRWHNVKTSCSIAYLLATVL